MRIAPISNGNGTRTRIGVRGKCRVGNSHIRGFLFSCGVAENASRKTVPTRRMGKGAVCVVPYFYISFIVSCVLFVKVQNSGASQVYLNSLELSSSGRYRCEVSGEAPSFTTVTEHNDMITVGKYARKKKRNNKKCNGNRNNDRKGLLHTSLNVVREADFQL